MTEVSTSPLPKQSRAIELVQLQRDSNAEQQLENISGLLKKAKMLTDVLDKQIENVTDVEKLKDYTNDKMRRHAIILFQITTAFLAHNILNVITDFNEYALTMKGTDIFVKLEIDLISMNTLLHDFLNVFTLCTTYFRICDVKSDTKHRNQLIRMHNLIVRQTDALQHTAAYFIDDFSVAMGSADAAHSVTQHVKKAINHAGMWNTLMSTMGHMIHSGPVQSTLTALRSQKSMEIMHWIFRSARLFTPSFIPDSIDALLTRILEDKPGSVERKDLIPANISPKPTGEFGTLSQVPRKPPRLKAESEF